MVIFLYGPDSYRLKQNSNMVLDNYRKKYPDGVFLKFDLSDPGEISKAEDAIKSNSLFGGVKLIILKNLFSNKVASDRMGELVNTRNILKEKDTVLLIVENQNGKELAKNISLFSLLTKEGNMVRNFQYLEGANLTKWIKSEFVSRNCSVEQDAIRELVTVVGNESWSLVNEINKLCNFKIDCAIKKEDVTLLGFKKIDLNIFDFIDALAGKNKARVYEILFKEIKSGRDPYYLLTMMIYGFRGLLSVKDLSERKMSVDAIVKKTRLNPFVAKKAYRGAQKFSLLELKNIYGCLLELDSGFKEGTVNLVDSLFLTVLNPVLFQSI